MFMYENHYVIFHLLSLNIRSLSLAANLLSLQSNLCN